ncbi:phage tail protein [Laribacter hongkongensis]|uniref:phage tail protein n=1 Tax=Laribacter hongkongensis TaxID=168471 RepID=UPI001EFCD277|nr:phage tail protein [Laribacter hongkongensis]MCG8993214.1 phage tail protein [Laribacter hongkongensis]MCG8997967.1 phage tail protein [Laribacter hongkongensis]MCG9002322.1 phage tail protein [Laribacter hongkongensis]MCG9005632.1 phage tail protein [Laribacter hongkongensis]MCG9008769.1 phage tail protein [Laribacter hongkongensis]
MALQEYAGAIVLEVDGKEVEVIDLGVNTRTGRKLVKTMNKTGRAKGIAEYDLSVTVAIPLTGDLDWEAVEGAKLTVYPASSGGQRESYLDCFTTEVGEKYSVDNEARRDLKLQALRKVKE